MKLFRNLTLMIGLIASSAVAQPTAIMTPVTTGSELAVWQIAPERAARKTPVIFLHGGPGL
jgi:hypothetical protein